VGVAEPGLDGPEGAPVAERAPGDGAEESAVAGTVEAGQMGLMDASEHHPADEDGGCRTERHCLTPEHATTPGGREGMALARADRGRSTRRHASTIGRLRHWTSLRHGGPLAPAACLWLRVPSHGSTCLRWAVLAFVFHG